MGAWHYRVIEQSNGTWACRHGSETFDHHPSRQQAIEHTLELAAAHRPATIYQHRLFGQPRIIARLVS